MLPYVGSFVEKTADSTGSANLAQLNSAMGRFITEKNRVPHHLDSLINHADATAAATGSCVGATAGDVFCGLANPAAFEAVTYEVGTDDIALASLEKANLTMYLNNNPNAATKTFSTGTGMLYIPPVVGQTTRFARLPSAPATRQLLSRVLGGAGMDYYPECYDYIAMGIGDQAELVGNTITSSPVHYPKDASTGPTERYGHYIAIFQVDRANTGDVSMDGGNYTHTCSTITEPAKFVGTVLNTADITNGNNGLVGVKNALETAYINKVSN